MSFDATKLCTFSFMLECPFRMYRFSHRILPIFTLCAYKFNSILSFCGHYLKARGPFSHLIAGIITTRPGFTLGNRPEELQPGIGTAAEESLRFAAAGRPLLALLGRVPVKATTENGEIRPGDLLTVSSKPGSAMRCADAKACKGAIIGKALEGLERGEGMILVLLMSRTPQ